MAHNLGQILLYRPFLHYFARVHDHNPPDHRQLRCAAACVKTSRQTITRSDEMLQQGYLAPAAWQSVYTIFLAIVALIFYLATQQGAPDYAAIQVEAQTGIKILASTSCQDIGSRRCLDVLKVLARRLAHIVQLDIEAIEKQAGSFCQADVPTPMAPDYATQPLPRVSVPGIVSSQYMNSPYTQSPMNMHAQQQQQLHQQPPVLRSNNGDHNGMAMLPSHHPGQHSSQPNQPNPVAQPHYTHMGQPAMMQQRMAATASGNPPLQHSMFSGSTEEYMPHTADMEVPFTEQFAWPFDPNVAAGALHEARGMNMAGTPGALNGGGGTSRLPGANNGGGPAPSSNASVGSGHSPLTSEDIAAFMMRINPGEEPFL
jgi:hypothetical protein